jgi:hypothetical protein
MRKALIPMFASLALAGAAATAMVISSAHAQPGPHKPLMVAMTATPGLEMAANDTPPGDARPLRGLGRPAPGDIAARIKQMCQDQVARQTGQLAYLETKLNLTAAEQPLFQRWKEARLGIARRHADQCAQRPARQAAQAPQGQTSQGQASQRQAARTARPGPADRMAREEDRLKLRLADIEAERPALEAFTNALSPEQKMELMRGEMGGPRGMMMRRRFADAMGPGMMNQGRPGMMGPERGAPPPVR